MTQKVDTYKEFNQFQNNFYLNISEFNKYSKYEIKQNGYILLNNLIKGFPAFANIILNLNGFGWKGPESPSILKACQRKFINNFNKVRVPEFVYYKGAEIDKTKKKVIETSEGLIFSNEIIVEICNILIIDSKTYNYLKFTPKVQFLGKQLLGEILSDEGIKKRTKKKIT